MLDFYCLYYFLACFAPHNGQIDCGNGLARMALEENNCTFTCDPGYMLQVNITNGTCQNTGNWSGGLPHCVPLNCSTEYLPVSYGAIVLQSSTCSPIYQSQCTVSCDYGYTGSNVTYLCNVTSDPAMVNWMIIGRTEVNHICTRGLLQISLYCIAEKLGG